MRNFKQAKRIVIKIGTSTLTTTDGVNSAYIRTLAAQVAYLRQLGKQVILVSSGAIGMGAKRLKLTGPVTDMKMRQACAAIGQPLLMHEYHKAFGEAGMIVSQVLLTAEVLNHRKSYLNLRNAIEQLLHLGIVPIINENDCVSTAEIGTAFGDNDKLSALVASKIDADLLIMLTDIDALYDKDPRKYKEAKPVHFVEEITEPLIKAAGGRGSAHGTGGMKTKLQAASIASAAGCRTVLAHGKEPDVIQKIIDGQIIGTLFAARQEKLSNRARWILHNRPEGTIYIDEGAMAAIRKHKSLLPSGVKGVEGTFPTGAVVMINDAAKAITSLSSDELNRVAGLHSTKIRDLLGPNRRDVVALPEDIVFVETG
ncbi:MAG TPA: glutamate 5-kinase [Anaerohalosphaeraceae bacterium]|nr:glutamate 5-kinase [Phycisphaerae bacterium]HOL31579.1 glutamate 5-kinase [Anaerohalosphaeraceae bacterium]HOM75594.1 glutamate 5-kinase [Anaerohalosphaeraceae bacterium]HPC63522.1 glutamate 5-kinase [Anaerohalosphaeraceae bacterium]HPO69541.1 glutamate 5-kinase [Anaerohalosphaeraceae bacterium]